MDEEKRLRLATLRRVGHRRRSRRPHRRWSSDERFGGMPLFLRSVRVPISGMVATFALAFLMLFVGKVFPAGRLPSMALLRTPGGRPVSEVKTIAIELENVFRDPVPWVLGRTARPWQAAPWLAGVALAFWVGAHLVRRWRRPKLGFPVLLAAATSFGIAAVATTPLPARLADSVRIFPGALVVLAAAAAGTFLLVRLARPRHRSRASLAGALPALLVAALVALNLGVLTEAPETGLLGLFRHDGVLRNTTPVPVPLLESLRLLPIPMFLIPALAAGEGLGFRESFDFVGRALLRRPVPTLLAHVGLLVVLVLPLRLLVELGLSIRGVPVLWRPSFVVQVFLTAVSVIPIALFFSFSVAAARALRVAVDGPYAALRSPAGGAA